MNFTSMDSVDKTINEYSNLKDNWDAEGARAPRPEDIANAHKVVSLINYLEIPLPMVQISGNGEISFVWRDRETGAYIDLGFVNGGYSCYAIDENKEEFFKDENYYQEDEIKKLCGILRKKIYITK